MVRRLGLATLLTAVISASHASAQVRLHEVVYDPSGTDAGQEKIELINLGASDVDLSRWAVFVDSRTTFDQDIYLFESGRILPAGAFLTVHWQTSGPSDVDDVYTESEGSWYAGGTTPIDNDWCGISLFEDDNDRYVGTDFSDSTKIRDFLQIGNDATTREVIAANANLWRVNDVVVDRGEGISLVRSGPGNRSTDWFGDVRGFQQGDNGLATRPAVIYGTSCAGSGGYAPEIPETVVWPGDPNTRFQVSLLDGLGPLAFLVIGLQQDQVSFGPTCTLWTTFDFLIGPFPMDGGPGQGEGRLLLDGTNPAPGSGLDIYLTFFCQDASESKGFTLSNALHLQL